MDFIVRSFVRRALYCIVVPISPSFASRKKNHWSLFLICHIITRYAVVAVVNETVMRRKRQGAFEGDIWISDRPTHCSLAVADAIEGT